MATGLAGQFSALPGARSKNELARAVLRFVGLPDDTDALSSAFDAIDSGIREVNTKAWKWSLVYDDITPVVNQFDYALPRDVRNEFNLELQDSSGNPYNRLEFKPHKTFLLEHFNSTTAGTPYVYSILGYHAQGLLQLDKMPDQAWVTKYPTMRFWYMRRVLFPGDGEAVNVPSEVEHFIEWYAKEDMASQFAQDRVKYAMIRREQIWHSIKLADLRHYDWAGSDYSHV